MPKQTRDEEGTLPKKKKAATATAPLGTMKKKTSAKVRESNRRKRMRDFRSEKAIYKNHLPLSTSERIIKKICDADRTPDEVERGTKVMLKDGVARYTANVAMARTLRFAEQALREAHANGRKGIGPTDMKLTLAAHQDNGDISKHFRFPVGQALLA